MWKSRNTLPTIETPRVRNLLERLYAEVLLVDAVERDSARERGLVDDQAPQFYEAMARAYMPITPEFGRLLYVLARGIKAQCVVEFGTSFGISTIFLASALKDNGRGRVITTELIPEKAQRAMENIRAAGLDGFVEFRVGDARATLAKKRPKSVDMLLLDGPKNMYMEILRSLEPHLGQGALIASDNTDMPGTASYRDFVRVPGNGYIVSAIETSALGSAFGHEIVVRSRW